MNEQDKLALIEELNQIHTKCSDQLFKLHNDRAKGQLVEENEHLVTLLDEIKSYRDRIDIIQIERSQIEMIREHNQKVDVFTQKFDDQGALLTEMRKLEQLMGQNTE